MSWHRDEYEALGDVAGIAEVLELDIDDIAAFEVRQGVHLAVVVDAGVRVVADYEAVAAGGVGAEAGDPARAVELDGLVPRIDVADRAADRRVLLRLTQSSCRSGTAADSHRRCRIQAAARK